MIFFFFFAEVVCEPPTSPENGYIQGGSSYKAGEVVQFHCHRGFMMDGQPIAVCQDNGKWSGSFPKCNQSSFTATHYSPIRLENFKQKYINYWHKLQCNLCVQYLINNSIFCQSFRSKLVKILVDSVKFFSFYIKISKNSIFWS